MTMKNTQNVKFTMKEWMAWLLVGLVTIAAFVVTYFFHLQGPVKALLWISWLVLVFVFGFFTPQGKKFYIFGQEAKTELEKVSWPTRQETIQTTSIVMIMVTVTGFVLWGIDSGMMWTIGKITQLG